MSDNIHSVFSSERKDFGRIEVVPEILVSIAQRNTLRTEGIAHFAEPPSSQTRRLDKRLWKDGVLLNIDEHSAIFDIYVIMDANVNIMDTGRKLQSAVVEGIERMVGIAVTAVNVHVEDVVYPEA